MKKSILLFGCSLMTMYGFSQSDVSGPGIGHQRAAGRFVGWSPTAPGSVAGSLEIRNDFNFPISLHTNGVQRMHINQNIGLTDGFIGMGNGFNTPQSHLHINNPTNQETWMQITNNITGQTPIDGLRIGMFDNNAGLLSFIRWHERSPIIFQTLGSTISSNEINNGERLRISAIGDGSPDPFNVQGNETRIAVSHNGIGGDPITRIRSLFHIGYNTGAMSGNINLNDGWRSWMDVGTFTNTGREHMYFGFKQEVEGGVIGLLPEDSHYEAIINWGDNEIAGVGERNTNLRFIYTTPQIGTVNTPQSQVDGLETMRIEPTVATTLAAPNFGMVGIGNFSSTGPNTAGTDVVDAKLDIDGDLRVRTVTQDNTLTRVLVVDPTDHNRVHWRAVSSIGGGGTGGTVTANNGLKINPSANNVQLGGPLVDPTIIDLNSKYLHFSNFGRIGIGTLSNAMMNIKNITNPSGANWANVLRLENSLNTEMLTFTDDRKLTIKAQRTLGEQAVYMENTIVNSPGTAAALYGLDVYTTSTDVSNPYTGARVRMEANSNEIIKGMFVSARSLSNGGLNNYIGLHATADRGTTGTNTGIWGQAANCSLNIGVRGTATGPIGATNWAGFFDGNVNVTGTVFANNGANTLSDQLFKQNIENINNATNIINQLQPRTYYLDSINYPQMYFDSRKHMGLIAQEVNTILPELVKSSSIPAHVDSLGNVISSSIDYLTLNYQEFIPLLIAGFKEQQSELDTKDSLIDNLQSEINYIKECLLNARICEEGNRTINQNPTTETNQKSIELINTNSIILDQNLPNPFAEHTVINYNIPDDVMEAKLMFYDFNGRIIKELIIEERGESKLTVYGTNLKTGVYTYSLVADGELIATKKMVKK